MSPSKLPETAANDLIIALGLLLRRVRSAVPSETDELSWTQKSVILRLEKDGPSTIAELARAEGIKPQSMGSAIAGLEDHGMIERTAHPTDKRQFNIRLTSKGIAVRKTTKDEKRTWLAEAISKLEADEQKILFSASEIIRRLAE